MARCVKSSDPQWQGGALQAAFVSSTDCVVISPLSCFLATLNVYINGTFWFIPEPQNDRNVLFDLL